MTRPVFALLKMHHPGRLPLPFCRPFALHFVVALKFRKKDQRHLRQSDILNAEGKCSATTFERAAFLHREPFWSLAENNGVIEISDASLHNMSRSATQLEINLFLRGKIL